jgi:hypothetical protein
MSEGKTMSKLHVDATLVAAHRMAELQAENEQLKEAWTRMSQTIEQLRAKLAEYELLLAVAIAREDPCLAHTFVGDVCRDCGLVAPRHVDGVRDESCACSPKYRELAPGVHAAYCPLAGKPLLQVPVEPVT